ncbi:hypothetical protein HCBG_01759 [Histoplasma capsulatum G186AR]|uniref:Glycosyltransferase 2 n=2 Tax=Ajellomyces capsulatus TaxID=5037 RepID=C0NFU3_AJECG|nr:uncharacterized protein HCBG_01759 [Histoplasma capsulatum G186AR]EEH10114.1 hypothetical protein HCBG_01759 [Histoplasma capsulatum G186AR]KAG5290930.1 hypothetical protein I7I52_08101 [Histoplasma capsulatum]QSS72857.1 hypothetical protein I7I50_00833 [Histoplasma capsulatum G186AR]
MTLPRRGYLGDEELGKKFDDHGHRTPAHFKPRSATSSWKIPRRRRVLLTLIGICIVYILFKAVPPSELTPATKPFDAPLNNNDPPRPGDPGQREEDGGSVSSEPPPKAPPAMDEIPTNDSYEYNGPIKFPLLTQSLHSNQALHYSWYNNAVLFAAANLQALSYLLPLACEMAKEKRNSVHFAVMGRSSVSVKGIQMVNGVDEESCPLFWHDARPDHASRSPDARMESSVITGLSRIANTFRPKVVITHSHDIDETFHWTAAKATAGRIGVPHISLPARGGDFMWLSKLDSHSLGAWDKVDVQILVQAPPASSGSLTRLLRSLQRADYFGDTLGLTIELPHNVDPPLLEYLKSFHWPPRSVHNHFTLRRRIQHGNITSEEATLRIVDSLYPKNPAYSHVLILSPQTELAPSYYHYLKYAILQHKYSHSAKKSLHRLLGISLELPSSTPTVDSEPFTPPIRSDSRVATQGTDKHIPVFLWQAPNSNAALYFGDKWVEFQSFLSSRLSSARRAGLKMHANLISKKFPSWMEYMLELTRCRGYYLLYPSFPAVKSSHAVLSTIHNELYRLPEEHTSISQSPKPISENPQNSNSQKHIADPNSPSSSGSSSSLDIPQEVELGSVELPLADSSTISSLLQQFPAGLPDELSPKHVLPYSQKDQTSPDLVGRTQAYMKEFREKVGGCGAQAQQQVVVEDLKADDLFCSEGEEGVGL